MAITITVKGTTYSYPSGTDPDWGTNATSGLQLVAASLENDVGNNTFSGTRLNQTTNKVLDAAIVDTDTALTANSDSKIPSQKATKSYVDTQLANLIDSANAVVYKGVIDCSTNPNYPAADAGHLYVVSVAGKIGGASGVTVEIGDLCLCNTDDTASGDQATVGTKWNVIQKNETGLVIGAASSTDSGIVLYDGITGKLIKDSGVTISTDGTLASNSDSLLATQKATKTYVDTKFKTQSINPQTDDYELVLADASKLIKMNKASAVNLNVPDYATVAFPVGTRIDIIQWGAGQVTITKDAGVDVFTTDTLKLVDQYSAATLINTDEDEWVLVGRLEEV